MAENAPGKMEDREYSIEALNGKLKELSDLSEMFGLPALLLFISCS